MEGIEDDEQRVDIGDIGEEDDCLREGLRGDLERSNSRRTIYLSESDSIDFGPRDYAN
jgi:hypothetical protein